MALALDEWIARLDSEYFGDFIPSGGASVKVAVVQPEDTATVLRALRTTATKHGFLVAKVDSGQVRVHMIHEVFHAVARQVEWDALADKFLRRLFQENGIIAESDVPLHDLSTLARANDRERTDLLNEINRLVARRVVQDYSLSKEFRTAMAMLCRGLINPQNVSPSDADLIKQWLRGEPCHLATLKNFQIYQRVGRHNARRLLASLAQWTREAGYSGLALLMDLNTVVAETLPQESTVRYSRHALLDTFEVLRQFIDDVDQVQYFFLGVVAGPGLLYDPRRNLDNYTALKMRLADEVRTRDQANPLNTMVHISVSAQEGEAAWTRAQ